MPPLNLEQTNLNSTEATLLGDGDQLDFNNQYASEGRARIDTLKSTTLENLSRLANETALTQLDQVQQTPEIQFQSVYPALIRTGSLLVEMRKYKVAGMLTSESLTKDDFVLGA